LSQRLSVTLEISAVVSNNCVLRLRVVDIVACLVVFALSQSVSCTVKRSVVARSIGAITNRQVDFPRVSLVAASFILLASEAIVATTSA